MMAVLIRVLLVRPLYIYHMWYVTISDPHGVMILTLSVPIHKATADIFRIYSRLTHSQNSSFSFTVGNPVS